MRLKYFILPLLTLPFGLVSCDDSDNDLESLTKVEMTSANTNANKADGDASVSRWEMPALDASNSYITHYTSDGMLNYALEWSKTANHSHWVAYRYDNKLNQQKTGRTDAWGVDPYFNSDTQNQIAIQTFYGEGYSYNRGHLVGSAERLYSVEANSQTFYMTNMSPMNGQFNSEYWGEIEDHVRDWGRACGAGDTLYVVKGGTIDNRVLGSIPLRTTAGGTVNMVIPQYYYIAVLSLSADGTAKAIGFWMEHKDYQNNTAAYKAQLALDSACSIDELEEKTGIDFFCNVPDWIENFVEKGYTVSEWSGLK